MAQPTRPNPQILKDDILELLKKEGLALFHVESDMWPNDRTVWWDTDRYPDYKQFITAAQAAGARMILFFDEELGETEINEAEEALDAASLPPEEYRDYARRIGDLRSYIGFTNRLGIGFASDGFFYWYDLEAAWYEDLMDLIDSLQLAGFGGANPDDFDEDDEDPNPPKGNFYSNN